MRARIAPAALLAAVALVNLLWMPAEFVDGDRSGQSLLLVNLANLACCLALAALLYAVSGKYSRHTGVRVLFVVAALYCTSLWFYQRAQSSEIYQTLAFTALYASLLSFLGPLYERGPRGLDARAWRWLAAAAACAAALALIRPLHLLLLPIISLLAAWCAVNGRARSDLRAGGAPLAAALLIPPVLIVAAAGIASYLKFGSAWSAGNLSDGRMFDGLWGLLFSPRFSVFLYFPLLIFALAGLRNFAERHRVDAVAMLSLFATYLVFVSSLPSWAGERTYGPRNLLPLLPALSLPFLTFADDVRDRIGAWRARAWAAAALACLLYSGHLQMQVNRLPFWTYYYAREAMAARSIETIDYFLHRHTGAIADDLVRHRGNLDALPFVQAVRESAPPAFAADFRRRLSAMVERGNLYWALPRAERR